MATHQELGGMTDADFVQRMVTSHAERYNEAFWEFFMTQVGAQLPSRPVVVDLGCGPGLFLRDVGARYPQATLYGYDVTPAMIAYGQHDVVYTGAKPQLALHDVTTPPLPLAAGSVHLLNMTAILHLLDDPLAMLTEIRRVLAPEGRFFLHDWVRSSLADYLTSRAETTGESLASSQMRWFRLFPVHNKYTVDDWLWLLAQGGFTVRQHTQLRPHFEAFITTVS